MPLLAELRQRGKAPSGARAPELPGWLLGCFQRALGVSRQLGPAVRHTLPHPARPHPPADAWLKGEYETKRQAELCNRIAVQLGFDLQKVPGRAC